MFIPLGLGDDTNGVDIPAAQTPDPPTLGFEAAWIGCARHLLNVCQEVLSQLQRGRPSASLVPKSSSAHPTKWTSTQVLTRFCSKGLTVPAPLRARWTQEPIPL